VHHRNRRVVLSLRRARPEVVDHVCHIFSSVGGRSAQGWQSLEATALVPSDELRLDEQHEGVGTNAVVGPRLFGPRIVR
jgi:hypothetical protein